jgi:hypothetical protein
MTMTIKLAPEMEQQLRRRSQAQGKPASALIREALATYLAATTDESPTPYALGADLFGKHRGPVALASQRKAMATEVWDAKQQARRQAKRRR